MNKDNYENYDDLDDFDDRLMEEKCFHCENKMHCRWYPNNLANAQCEHSEDLIYDIKLENEDDG